MIISIIVPIYFYNEYVELMLSSLLNQEYKTFEIVFVGNNITNTEFNKIKETIESKFINSLIEVKFIFTEIKGANNARQVGYENSKGKYVFFLDCDDQLKLNTIKEVNKIVERFDVDIISINLQHVKIEDNKIIKNNIVYKYKEADKFLLIDKENELIIKSFGTNICARFIKRSLLAGIHFLTLPYCQDWNISSKIFLNSKSFYFIEEPMYYWVYREDSISKIDSMSLEKHLHSFDSILDIINFYKKQNQFKQKSYFLNDRIIKFCFQYIGRSSFFDIEEGFKRSNELINKELQYNYSFFKNRRIIIMYIMIKFKFLYKLYFKLIPKLN